MKTILYVKDYSKLLNCTKRLSIIYQLLKEVTKILRIDRTM